MAMYKIQHCNIELTSQTEKTCIYLSLHENIIKNLFYFSNLNKKRESCILLRLIAHRLRYLLQIHLIMKTQISISHKSKIRTSYKIIM